MKRHLSALASVLVLCALLAPAVSAGVNGWVLLGERRVTDRLDRDVITVTAARGDFRKVQIRVQARAVQFHSVKLHFANGETQDLALREVIPAGGHSRVIDIEGHDRVIRSVELTCDAQSKGHPAVVKVFAQH